MTASPQDAARAALGGVQGCVEGRSGTSGPLDNFNPSERPVAEPEEPDDMGDGFTPYIGTIAEALTATPNGRSAAEYARARYGPGATFKSRGYASGGRLPEADPSLHVRAERTSPDAMFDDPERRQG